MIIANKIYHKETVENSFTWAKNNIHEPDGTVFLADYIEQARGRQGRSWQVYDGQILLTILLKPKRTELTHLSMAISLGILEALEEFGAKLKWPNDFVIGEKKVGGIMFESIFQGNRLVAIIAGIGINVNNNLDGELKEIATSLSAAVGKQIDLEKLLKRILSSTDELYKRFLDGKYEEIYKLWRDRQALMDQSITVHKVDGGSVCGIARELCENGDLFLEIESGDRMRFPFCIVESVEIKN